jgi:ketosteroid isomerase-like protein
VSQENVRLVRQSFELVNQGADEAFARYLAPDVEWQHNVGLGTLLEGIYRGREEVLAFFKATRESFGTLRLEVDDVRALSPAEVLVLGTMHVEGRGSGAAASTPFGAVIEIAEGLAVRQRFWADQGKALEAAGLRARARPRS